MMSCHYCQSSPSFYQQTQCHHYHIHLNTHQAEIGFMSRHSCLHFPQSQLKAFESWEVKVWMQQPLMLSITNLPTRLLMTISMYVQVPLIYNMDWCGILFTGPADNLLQNAVDVTGAALLAYAMMTATVLPTLVVPLFLRTEHSEAFHLHVPMMIHVGSSLGLAFGDIRVGLSVKQH